MNIARPLRIQYPGAYYHVTCRGNERRNIFLEPQDNNIFLGKLIISLEIHNVSLLAYVLMPNHFHFRPFVSRQVKVFFKGIISNSGRTSQRVASIEGDAQEVQSERTDYKHCGPHGYAARGNLPKGKKYY